MHGDDVASAGVSITTEVLSKASEAILELIKVGIERERYANRSSGNQSTGLSGGEVTYRRLKEGGEITTLPNFPKEDYGEFLKRAKKADIPVAAIQEKGKEHSLTLCIQWIPGFVISLFRRKPKEFVRDNNIILTNEVKMSLNTRQTRKNLNVMCIGGSGSGKSRFYVKPNLMQANTSYVCTDPKGELLRSTGKMLEHYGYNIKVFNLIDMAHSHNYNPFNYIYDADGNYSATAVIKMINVLMKNTQKEGGGGGDQFWEDST